MEVFASSQEITQYLSDWQCGNRAALEKLVPIVQSELKILARKYLRRESRDVSIQTTELINEAYLRLIETNDKDWQNRIHFFAVAARIMRNLLIDRARKRKTKNAAAVCAKFPSNVCNSVFRKKILI